MKTSSCLLATGCALSLFNGLGCGSRTAPPELFLSDSPPTQSSKPHPPSSPNDKPPPKLPERCAALRASEPLEIETNAEQLLSLALAYASSSRNTVALYYGAVHGPETALRVIALDPWDAWPPSRTSGIAIRPLSKDTFAASYAPFERNAILLRGFNENHEESLLFSNGVTPTFASPHSFTQLVEAPVSARPAFLISGHEAPMVGMNYASMANLFGWVEEGSIETLRYGIALFGEQHGFTGWALGSQSLSCAKGPLEAAATRAGQDFLLVANSGQAGPFCDPESLVGDPTYLLIQRIRWISNEAGLESPELTQVAALGLSELIREPRVMVAAGRTWIFFRDEKNNTHFLIAGLDGTPLTDPIAVQSKGTVVASLPLGEAPVILLKASDASSLEVLELEDDGSVSSLFTLTRTNQVEAASVIKDSSDSQLLLAWSERDAGRPRLYVSELTCERSE